MKLRLVYEVETSHITDVLKWNLDRSGPERGDVALVHFPGKDKLFICCPGCGEHLKENEFIKC